MSGTSGTSGIALTELEEKRLWFSENITLNITKIRLSNWSNKSVVPVDISLSDTFLGVINDEVTKTFSYLEDWKIITPVITLDGDLEKSIQASYYTKEVDGRDFYRKMRATLLKSVIIGERTEAEADEIDVCVDAVICKILTGDWKSAYNRLLETTPNGAYTQEFKDNLTNDIILYITQNY